MTTASIPRSALMARTPAARRESPPAAPHRPSAAPSGRPRRIVLYSHDTQGLGHMRRNLLLARALLRADPRPNILLIGGARELGALPIPPGIDCVTLPALGKDGDGGYQPRSLGVSLRRVVALRAAAIAAALQSFDPDVLIVDKVPLGAFDELASGLEWLRARGEARVVLGLRDILDEPEVARREWALSGADAAISRYYSAIWVYGDPRIYDPARAYGLSPAVTARITYTGYIDRGVGLPAGDGLETLIGFGERAPLHLCMVGGGQDGFALAEAFAQAELPEGSLGVIVSGPFMPEGDRARLAELVGARPEMRLLNFVEEPAQLLRRAASVVAMAGYNTVCEILALEKPALLMPRVRPRREQLLRAERLRELGLTDMLHPDELSPQAIGGWLRWAPARPSGARAKVDMGALDRLPALVDALFAPSLSLKERIYGA